MRIENDQSDQRVLDELGRRLALRRRACKLTQAKVAMLTGLSKRTIERIEAGDSTLLANLIKVFRVLNMMDRLDGLIPDESVESLQHKVASGGKNKSSASASESESSPREWCCW